MPSKPRQKDFNPKRKPRHSAGKAAKSSRSKEDRFEDRGYSKSSSSKPSAKRSERSAQRSARYEAQKATREKSPERAPRRYESETPAPRKREPDRKLEKFVSEKAQGIQTFQEMDLPERLVMELAKGGIATPFPIQAATIPAALGGRDVLGRGKTGSGKTIAFGFPGFLG